jgi:hypothetical protein
MFQTPGIATIRGTNLSAELSKTVNSSSSHFTSRFPLFDASILFDARIFRGKTAWDWFGLNYGPIVSVDTIPLNFAQQRNRLNNILLGYTHDHDCMYINGTGQEVYEFYIQLNRSDNIS